MQLAHLLKFKYKERDGKLNGLTYFNDSSIDVVTDDSVFSDPMKVCICMDDDTIICPQKYIQYS